MSLKRRNLLAILLMLLAAICWVLGQQMLNPNMENRIAVTTHPGNGEGIAATIVSATTSSEDWTTPGTTTNTGSDASAPGEVSRTERMFGMCLSFVALLAAILSVFVLSQQNPGIGPDGICLLLALLATAYHLCLSVDYVLWDATLRTLALLSRFACAFVILLSTRELFGWLLAGCSLSWCLVYRAAKRSTTLQIPLLMFAGWLLLAVIGIVFSIVAGIRHRQVLFCTFGYLATAVFGFLCLWKYGADLTHFKKQLDNYQSGKPITVGDGAFAQTEAQLLDVQAQHEDAVRTAVTSERFKVELISNVSHDLRTPLTSILGYSELLQNETLSSEGQEQLRRLQQKAGYMNDLVESLFELTKVSSGVLESRKDQIDLVRLLEQTIGLFDDQLTSAGLTVRRSYGADSIPVVTDGARMHQVFANLLGNAIKYSLAGTRIYLEIQETENSYLVRMMNTASYEMDFEPDEILQRFARGDKARSTSGSGLGLAIAQTYTGSVGGTFRVSVDGDQFNAIVELPKTERNL